MNAASEYQREPFGSTLAFVVPKIAPKIPDGQCDGSGADSLVHSNGVISGERGKPDYLAEHRGRVVKRFTPAKRRARAMARYIRLKAAESPEGSSEVYGAFQTGTDIREQLEKLQHEVAMCRNHLLFKNHFQEGRVTLSRMKSCKHTRLCPLCAVASANGHVVAYHAKTLQLIQEYRERGVELRAYFVTLTIKNGVSLPETYQHFSGSVQNLVDRRSDAMKARAGSVKNQYALNSTMASVIAGVFSIEVKRGSGSGLWHPHTHGLLLSTEAIDKWKLSKEWEAITKDSYIVDVREIDATDTKSLCEILKYSLKFSEMTLEDNFNAAVILHRKHLLRGFGEFHGLKPDKTADIDDISVLNSPFIEQLYAYRKGSYGLVPSDGTVQIPEYREKAYEKDDVPTQIKGYNFDFRSGILILCGSQVKRPNGPKHELSTTIHLPVGAHSLTSLRPVGELSPTIQRDST